MPDKLIFTEKTIKAAERVAAPAPKEPALKDAAPTASPAKTLSPAAERALQEAAARRAKAEAEKNNLAPEHHGRGGLEPTRYSDWEVKGIASDF